MVDKQVHDWITRSLDSLTNYIEAVDKRCTDCRIHCDRSRESCTLRGDFEKRLRLLENAVAAMQAATWKGAILTGTCMIMAATITIITNYFLRG